jgi:hypothetical protein
MRIDLALILLRDSREHMLAPWLMAMLGAKVRRHVVGQASPDRRLPTGTGFWGSASKRARQDRRTLAMAAARVPRQDGADLAGLLIDGLIRMSDRAGTVAIASDGRADM